MRISDIKVTPTAEYNEISANIDDFRLWYRFPKHIEPELRADPFIAAALLPAMSLGEDIEVDKNSFASPTLLQNIETLQDIFVLWGPHFNVDFMKVKLLGGHLKTPSSSNLSSVSFFSGGVDGTYTFLKQKDSIDYLLFSKGIDLQLENERTFWDAFKANQSFLKARQKEIYPIETNVRFLGYKHELSWNCWNGAGLASIALAGGFKQCFIASGISYGDMYPEGTSFITDHLWSNEHTTIVHDGAETKRIDKIRAITAHKDYLDVIRVCWHDKGYNCGECVKCLTTMSSLRALNIRASTFPECTDHIVSSKIAKLKLYNKHDVTFAEENLNEASLQGDKILHHALLKILRRFKYKKLIRLVDDILFNQRISKTRNKWRIRK